MISIDQIFNNQYYKKSNWIYLLIPFSIIFYCISISKNYLYKNGFLKRIKIKVPVLIIIGKQEAEKKQLSVRRLGSNDTETFDLKTITDALAKEAKAP